ncbi:Uncharacterised protein [uncultured archaeon]|nr:Uncharacterised protein [uncultured archaeon]
MNMPISVHSLFFPASQSNASKIVSSKTDFISKNGLPTFPSIGAVTLSAHPQAVRLLAHAKKLYQTHKLARCSDELMRTAFLLEQFHPRAPGAALVLIETAAEIQRYLGRTRRAKQYFQAGSKLAKLWGFEYTAADLGRRADAV